MLKRGGRLLLTVPYHGRLQAAAIALTRFDAHFDPLGQHVRFFTRRSLARTLDGAGFAPGRRSAAAARMLVGARYALRRGQARRRDDVGHARGDCGSR